MVTKERIEIFKLKFCCFIRNRLFGDTRTRFVGVARNESKDSHRQCSIYTRCGRTRLCICAFYFSVARSTVQISNAFAGTLKIVRDTGFRNAITLPHRRVASIFVAVTQKRRSFLLLVRHKKKKRFKQVCRSGRASHVREIRLEFFFEIKGERSWRRRILIKSFNGRYVERYSRWAWLITRNGYRLCCYVLALTPAPRWKRFFR